MKLKVKDMDIATGRVMVVVLNQKDAQRMDLHHNDRLFFAFRRRKAIAVLDIAESDKVVPPGRIGLYEEMLDALHAKDGDQVYFRVARKPKSVRFIKKKLDGAELNAEEINEIIKDIVFNNLTDVELTGYIIGNYIRGMTMKEVVALTKSMAFTGLHLSIRKKPIMDVHSIGGVPGNRTTPIMVPIIAAAGLTIPKTSSRAITSPAGTADTLEVITKVALTHEKLERLAYQVGGFMIWGGSVALAPADDKIIAVEHPLNIDAQGQMLASIMAKKASVGATHLVLEIPVDAAGKVKNKRAAIALKKKFKALGRHLGIDVHVIITDGSQPIGNGIGPALEARDVIWVLTDDRRGPSDLREKSIMFAGHALEVGGKAKKGKGKAMAKQILDSGAAYAKFIDMVQAQGGPEIIHADEIPLSKLSEDVKAPKTGKIVEMENALLAHIAKSAGAPSDHGSGIYLHKHKGDKVKRGEILYTIYANNKDEMGLAIDAVKDHLGVVIK